MSTAGPRAPASLGSKSSCLLYRLMLYLLMLYLLMLYLLMLYLLSP